MHKTLDDVPIPAVRSIVRITASEWGLAVRDVLGRSRIPNIAEGRHTIVGLALTVLPGMTLSELGRVLDRDHKTISNSREVVRSRLGQADYRERWRRLEDLVRHDAEVLRWCGRSELLAASASQIEQSAEDLARVLARACREQRRSDIFARFRELADSDRAFDVGELADEFGISEWAMEKWLRAYRSS